VGSPKASRVFGQLRLMKSLCLTIARAQMMVRVPSSLSCTVARRYRVKCGYLGETSRAQNLHCYTATL